MITSRTIKVNKCNESMYIIFSQFYHSISEIFHKEWNPFVINKISGMKCETFQISS